ncbi:MAG TPA: ferritin-like domain-containing protein [Thermoanaerobaculia bacterium]|nr:ferritin-like domain-containing protein [Thermoanaerobaculia bacterium]
MNENRQRTVASESLLSGLNDALNREVSTCLRYVLQVASLKGVEWANLRDLYAAEVQDELGHAQYLANKIVMLGGEPSLDPDLEKPPKNPRTMLALDIDQEMVDVQGYRDLAEQAAEEGLIELQLKMEEQAADEARHAEELTRMLG